MDENKTILDIKPFLKPKTENPVEVKYQQSLHSNPIFKKFLCIHNKKTETKFSLKDLFR